MSKDPKSILLVEDNEDDVFAFKWAFRKTQLEVNLDIVTDGQQALDYLTEAKSGALPLLVLLDLKLPYFTGHEILEWMRESPEFECVPVAILSGSDEIRDHERAMASGAMAYVVKPISPEDLSRLVKSALATP